MSAAKLPFRPQEFYNLWREQFATGSEVRPESTIMKGNKINRVHWA